MHVQRWMATPDQSPAYRRQRPSTLRGFCGWLMATGVLDRDPCAGIKPPRQPRYAPKHLPHREVGQLLASCADTRTRVIVLLIVQEGLQRIEVARAEIGNLDLRRETITVHGKGGHGHATRILPLSDETVAALLVYTTGAPGAGPLIRSTRHPSEGLSVGYIGDLVRRAMLDAGIKQAARNGRSAHALRHTALTDILDGCGDLRVVQRAAGHASIQTTECYTAGSVAEIRDAMAGRSYLSMA